MKAQILSWKVGFFNCPHHMLSKSDLLQSQIACFFFKCCPFPVRRGWTSPFSGTSGTTPVTMNSSILRWVRETSAGDVCVLKVILSWLFPNAQMAIHYLQEMYERTSQSRGESLDPNPMGQGEFIEHRHAPITCNNETRSFPMLKVGLWQWTLQRGTFFSTDVGP